MQTLGSPAEGLFTSLIIMQMRACAVLGSPGGVSPAPQTASFDQKEFSHPFSHLQMVEIRS